MAQFFRLILSLSLLSLTIAVSGCNRKDPNPELVDPLFMELERQKKGAETELKAAEDAVLEAEGNMRKVTPQTGQIKYATKRLNDARARVIKHKQIIQYYDVKIESRKFSAREEYLNGYYEQKPWPNPEALELFKLNQKLSQNERDWSAKKRREELGFPTQDTQKATQPKEPAAAPPAH